MVTLSLQLINENRAKPQHFLQELRGREHPSKEGHATLCMSPCSPPGLQKTNWAVPEHQQQQSTAEIAGIDWASILSNAEPA